MTEEMTRLDADVLAALDYAEKTIWVDYNWVPDWLLYRYMSEYGHEEVDAAVTRLKDSGKIETKHTPTCGGGEEYCIRLAPAGRNKD